MDGHSSHYCLDTIHLAAKEEVIVFVLPPNTTHLTQPLDKGVFGPLKRSWREVCHDYLAKHFGQVVTKYDFSQLFSKAWMSTMTMRNIVSGFSITGIFPVNRDALTLPVNSSSNPDETKSHLTYVTLYTPLKRQAPRNFTPEELDLFKKCYLNGFDMSSNWRYLLWLKTNHPERLVCDESERASLEDSYQPAKHTSCIQKFLEYPSPPVKHSELTEETSARVLTNSECVSQLEEKRWQKEAIQEQKKKRDEERKKRKKEKKLEKQMKDKQKKKAITSTPSKGVIQNGYILSCILCNVYVHYL